MELEFSGAAREVTGSCHVVRANGRTILLDCGLFQGRRAESREKNVRLPVPVDEIDAVVLSHAHIDHAGRLPFLVSRGYDGTIWATSATRDLCAIMLADSAHIQEKDADFLRRRHREAGKALLVTDGKRQGGMVIRNYPSLRIRIAHPCHVQFTPHIHCFFRPSRGHQRTLLLGS